MNCKASLITKLPKLRWTCALRNTINKWLQTPYDSSTVHDYAVSHKESHPKWKGEKWNPLKLTQNYHTICQKFVGWPPTEFHVSPLSQRHTSSLSFCRTNVAKWKQKLRTSATAAINDCIPYPWNGTSQTVRQRHNRIRKRQYNNHTKQNVRTETKTYWQFTSN